MAFRQPFLLLLLPLLAYFAFLGRPAGRTGRGRAWAALVLRCLIVALIIFGLAGAQSLHGGDELAVVFLLDASDSIPATERERGLDFVQAALAAMDPDDQAALVLFGADALVERPMRADSHLGPVASIPRTDQTDLEGAIRLGAALFPAGAARRMVLLSDGRPTSGDAEAAVRLARAQNVQLDTVSLGALPEVEVWLTDIDLPTRLHQGEEFTLVANAESSAPVLATLTVLAGEQVVAQQPVRLNPGRNRFAMPLTADQPGFATYRVVLSPAADTYPQNNSLSGFTLVEGPPRILLVAADEEEAAPLREALLAAGFDLRDSSPSGLGSDPATLAEYGAIILANTPAQSLSPRAMAALQSYVRDLGGGLVAVGGPDAYGVGGWYDTPLEETLPVAMTIDDPERFPPLSVVVVIDKSGSMSVQENGVQKIRLAGEAAARVAELINDLDEITIIAFDDRPADVIGPLPGSQRESAIDQVTRLQAGGGGIYVRESLQAALGYLANSTNPVRHIILLADGSDSEHQEGVPALVEEEIAGQNITLSTVAIGAGPDLRFLEEIATLGGGRYYFTDQAANLPTIFAQDTQLAMRSYIVEEPFFPRQTSTSPILTDIAAAPQLAGYVATSPKPAAQVILATHQDDPLLAVWQYGLGRAVAWTSDATGRWAQQWVGWEEFPRFWAQTVRWTIARQTPSPVEMEVSRQGEMARITLDALDSSGDFLNGLEATVSSVGPDGQTEVVPLAQTGPGQYEGTFRPRAEGVYVQRLVGLLEGQEVVALTTGWVLDYAPEYGALEADPAALAHLAELGGGHSLTNPADVFAHTLHGEGVARDLWPYLLALATLLLPLDVGVRRLALGRRDMVRTWERVKARLGHRRSPPAEPPSPVDRLFRAKERAGQQRRPAAGPPVPPPPPSPTPSPPAPPTEPPPSEEGTLAERLLRRRRR